jgi:hypothetical protein
VGGVWKAIPPSPHATLEPPFALGSLLAPRGRECRVVGFAAWRYDIEYGRDQYDTYYRHHYSLSDGRLLCWCWGQWWLARPVDSGLVSRQRESWNEARFEGRLYGRYTSQTYAGESARGLLPHPFQWNSYQSMQDFIAEPFGPGGRILTIDLPGQATPWEGEFLRESEVLQAFALREFPRDSPYRTSPAAPPPSVVPAPAVAGEVSKSQIPRVLGVVAIAALLFLAIGAGAYFWDRQTKTIGSQWIACPAEAGQRITVSQGASRMELDPHLPQGALRYEVRVLDASGAALTTRKDFLDMSSKRRTLAMELPARTAALQVSCSFIMPVAGFRSWPVELRFLH